MSKLCNQPAADPIVPVRFFLRRGQDYIPSFAQYPESSIAPAISELEGLMLPLLGRSIQPLPEALRVSSLLLAGDACEVLKPMPRRRPVVLCVDDEVNGLEARKLLLEHKGYGTLIATNGREGLALFANNVVDAVILDYQMPGMNGDVVARRMKQIKPHVPVLLLSGYEFPVHNDWVDAFVSKGEPPATLLATVHDLLTVRFPFFARWLGNWKYRMSA
jgi:CheY-like chemotaxis protein